ncbi:hypothetical protein KSP39_PZI017919 [Platanthera zijinensis]|uniref:Wall-associated receptor kinase galacturonan-binding domain-containing protein n=1 Tax=Platanthera zijinensis TaxID=2320716 RepID=A0AAP0B5I9_9ASPA
MAFFILFFFILSTSPASAETTCRSSCGSLPIRFPLAIDDGCGSPAYRRLLSCLDFPTSRLLLRTPSGSYPVHSLSYSGDPHLIISDPSMWTCSHLPPLPSSPFSLDASTRFSLSSRNAFLFLNCSPDAVLVQPRSPFCDRYPGRCGSSCDSAAYLCRNLPGCPKALAERATTCCSYFPTSTESVRMMLRHCAAYAGVYWRATDGEATVDNDDEPPEYGIRLNFDIPSTERCRLCEEKGAGTCGFDTATGGFLCLCRRGNSTTTCEDGSWRSRASAGVIAVPASIASLAAVVGMGALVYYLRKMKSNKVVTCGVDSTENRTF